MDAAVSVIDKSEINIACGLSLESLPAPAAPNAVINAFTLIPPGTVKVLDLSEGSRGRRVKSRWIVWIFEIARVDYFVIRSQCINASSCSGRVIS